MVSSLSSGSLSDPTPLDFISLNLYSTVSHRRPRCEKWSLYDSKYIASRVPRNKFLSLLSAPSRISQPSARFTGPTSKLSAATGASRFMKQAQNEIGMSTTSSMISCARCERGILKTRTDGASASTRAVRDVSLHKAIRVWWAAAARGDPWSFPASTHRRPTPAHFQRLRSALGASHPVIASSVTPGTPT